MISVRPGLRLITRWGGVVNVELIPESSVTVNGKSVGCACARAGETPLGSVNSAANARKRADVESIGTSSGR